MTAIVDFGQTDVSGPLLLKPIAGLPLIVRLLLPLRRAGVHWFFLLGPVSREVLRVLEGDSRLRGRVHAVASLDPVRALGDNPLLIMRGLVALDREMTEDLVRRAEKDTSFFTLDPATDGTSGPSRWQGVGVVRMPNPQDLSPPDDLPRLLETLRAKGRLEVHPASAKALEIVRDPADAEAWEHRLFAKLEAQHGQPWFQRVVNRRLSTWVTRHLVSTPITPNQVTAASLAVGLLAAACFLPESFAWSLLGWLLFESSYVLDCVDGEIARLKMQESALGAWVDSMADNVVQAAILFVLGVRLQRSTGHWGFLALGMVGAAGILITGAVVTHYLVRDRSLRLADVRTGWIGRLGLWRLGASLEETANRDPFALALLAGVVFNRVDLFLWVTAVGVNVYLALLLLLKRCPIPADTLHLDAGALSPAEAERRLGASLANPTDTWFTRLCRRLLTPIVLRLARTRLTPTQLTMAWFALNLVGALLLARGSYWPAVLGTGLCLTGFGMDLMDGMLARLKFLESRRGARLDLFFGFARSLIILIALTAAVARIAGRSALLPGSLLLGGALIAIPLVWCAPTGPPAGRWLAETLGHGDWLLILFVCALFDQLNWFFWAAAVGANMYWMSLLAIRIWGWRHA